MYLRVTNSGAQSLCSKGVLTYSSGSALALPFTIPNFVWKHIQKHRHLIFDEGEENNPQLLAAFDRLENDIRRNQF